MNTETKHIMLAIKPHFATRIFAGAKDYEFRKSFPYYGNGVSDTFLLYATAPVRRIVGYIRTDETFTQDVQTLWTKCGWWAGVTEKEFMAYYKGKKSGVAIHIAEAVQFPVPVDPREDDAYFVSPQSYKYVTADYFNAVCRKGGQA